MKRRLGEALLEKGLVDKNGLKLALAHQKKTGKPLGECLIELELVNEEQLASALAEQQDVETWDLKANPPASEALALVPPEICVKHLLLPVGLKKGTLILAMRNPGDLMAIDLVRAITRKPVLQMQALDRDLAQALQTLFGHDPTLARGVEDFVSKALDEFTAGNAKLNVDDEGLPVREEDTRPVIGLVNQIITDGIEMRASDIHIEPRVQNAELRYRVDGRLVKMREIPRALVPMVAARVMIMADMDISNRRAPQDGRIEVRSRQRAVDLRVSMLPTHYGPRIVMRILDRTAILRDLDTLGFNEDHAALFRELISKPHGIVLVTGPTGSGKTTTLYAAVNSIRTVETNILTVEDPIEYDIHGVNQSQVNEKAGVSFASGLRAILRQDPDVILLGEVRDKETAETAIQAALTGHLVLTTLHCNNAASAMPRLLDIGIEPYLLSTALIGVVSQRLLRVLCPHCKEKSGATAEEEAMARSVGAEPLGKVWRAVGCAKCLKTGYSGRVAVHEILPVTDEIASLIAATAPVEAVRKAAEPYGFRGIQLDALDRVRAGLTTIAEAQRVIFFGTFGLKKPATKLKLAS